MTNENAQNSTADKNPPAFIAKQYRVIATEEGYQTRKERIGVVFKNENSMCLRLNGVQLIEGDVYFFPVEETDNQQ